MTGTCAIVDGVKGSRGGPPGRRLQMLCSLALRLFIILLDEWIGYFFAAILRTDENQQSSSGNDETQ